VSAHASTHAEAVALPSSSPSSRDISPCCSLDHNGNVVTAKERKKGKKGRDDLELAGQVAVA
jgi:hypothetical protein